MLDDALEIQFIPWTFEQKAPRCVTQNGEIGMIHSTQYPLSLFFPAHQIKPYDPPAQMDKIMRLHAQTHHFEAGKVFLPNSAPWLDEYVRELTSFPGTKFDDQVDSTAEALDYLSRVNKNCDIWTRLAGY